nr:hypothetical protein [Tanacetum cinerariifolium]
SEVPHIQSPSALRVHVFVISEPKVLDSPSAAPVTTLSPPSVFTTPVVITIPHLQQQATPIPTPPIITIAPTLTTTVSAIISSTGSFAGADLPVLEPLDGALPLGVSLVVDETVVVSVGALVVIGGVGIGVDVSELKIIYHSSKALVVLKSDVPIVLENYIVELEKEYEKTPSEIIKIKREQAKKQKMPKYTIKSTDKATLKEFDHKSTLYYTMHENKSFNRNLANYMLYHALMEALIKDEDAMDKEVVDTIQDHK